MKKILYCFFMALVFISCKKDNTRVFDESSSVRVQKTLDAFGKQLTDAASGWKVVIFPKGGKGFSHWMTFDTNNRVTMVSDFNSTTTATLKTSSYRLKALEQPSLLFDTYNYIHLPADPNGSISGGTTSVGLSSDFEFFLSEGLIDSLKNSPAAISTMALTGRYNNSPIKFTRATDAEAVSYKNGGYNNLINPVNTYLAANKYLYVKLGDDKKIQVLLNSTSKTVGLSWEADGVVYSSTTVFAFTLTGIILKDPIVYNGKKIYELTWDNTNNYFYTSVDGVKVIVMTSPSPILPLHLVLGTPGFTTIVVPNATIYPGWSADFQARRAAANTAMTNGGYNLRLTTMSFKFDLVAKTMVLTAIVTQNSTPYTATFTYTYTKTIAGEFKFTQANPYVNGNGGITVAAMAKLLAERIDTDRFTVDYFNDPVEGVLGKMTSMEHNDFYFTGKFQ